MFYVAHRLFAAHDRALGASVARRLAERVGAESVFLPFCDTNEEDLVAEVKGRRLFELDKHRLAELSGMLAILHGPSLDDGPVAIVGDTDHLAAGLAAVQVADAPADQSAEMGRGALIVTVVPAPGFTLTVITCHLKSKLLTFPNGRFATKDEGERAGYGAYALYRRSAEAATVRELATEQLTSSDHERVVVLGDLNDEVAAATTQILHGPTGSEIGTPGFDQVDVGDRWRLWNLAPLIPAEQCYSRTYRGRPELIDHILVSHALLDPLPEVRSIVDQGLPSITDDPHARRGKPGSDHAPIVATFTTRPEPAWQ